MPELPEVETMVRGIRPAVEGRTITAARPCRCRFRPILLQPSGRAMAARAKGRTVVAVSRLAKRAVLELDGGDAFVIEPRMTGLLLVADPPDRSHLRFEWQLSGDGPERLLFWDRRGLGTVKLLSAAEREEQLGPAKLGPDPLTMSADDWPRICARTSRPIKVALLDQKLVAGIGNLYASEILHRAGIHPAKPADALGRGELRKLHEATRHVLQQAILYEGSTLGDGTYRNALNVNGQYQNAHAVYAKHGKPCTRCGKQHIERIVQAQRSTFFCPGCQGGGGIPGSRW